MLVVQMCYFDEIVGQTIKIIFGLKEKVGLEKETESLKVLDRHTLFDSKKIIYIQATYTCEHDLNQ